MMGYTGLTENSARFCREIKHNGYQRSMRGYIFDINCEGLGW